jgi:hypothetical protein
MKEARFWPKMKFEPIFFSGSLAVFQSERVASAGGRKGGLGGIPPALQILGEISSNFFESTPPVRKCLCWLALCEGSPADFKRKLEFFIFAPKELAKSGLPEFSFLILRSNYEIFYLHSKING